jgi:hypothetical protein
MTLLHGPRDWLVLMRIAPFAALVPALMRLPLPRLAALVTRPPHSRRPMAAEIERLERVMTLAPRISRPLVRSGCLTRGLTLYWFLRRAGLDVELRFGLDPNDGGDPTDGHCWLTLSGEPYLEPRDPRLRFSEIYRLPLATSP